MFHVDENYKFGWRSIFCSQENNDGVAETEGWISGLVRYAVTLANKIVKRDIIVTIEWMVISQLCKWRSYFWNAEKKNGQVLSGYNFEANIKKIHKN